MEIYAKTKKMSNVLSNESLLKKTYGKDIGNGLISRIAEFNAAVTLKDISHLKPQRLHQLKGKKYTDCFAVDITKIFVVFLKRMMELENELKIKVKQ
ncbi:hypothetical protein [Listeria seeligeri]|uniref:hypothetical protein n=1 Tax=Listeria seeligeri TaxID=1640 RepID=UPI001627DE64|nr:hypothetical protein [Listeria seeligeri]MBC1724505.1 hypothetical protein [Listeria seeligeri]MBF2437213.1 hypothetical protein [Listeria seeligeri]